MQIIDPTVQKSINSNEDVIRTARVFIDNENKRVGIYYVDHQLGL